MAAENPAVFGASRRSRRGAAVVPLFAMATAAVVAALATTPLHSADGATAADVQLRFDRLVAARRQILEDLAVPIEQCVRRRDTAHIAFHGCNDWHSSVHGIWALVKYIQLTGDDRYLPTPMGDAMAESLAAFYRRNPPDPMARECDNAS